MQRTLRFGPAAGEDHDLGLSLGVLLQDKAGGLGLHWVGAVPGSLLQWKAGCHLCP